MLKKASLCVVGLFVATLIGCTSRSVPGGGADKSHKFTLVGPATSTSIKQGETQTVSLTLDRGKDFKQTVNLKVEPPTGVEAVLDEASVKPSAEGRISLKVTATDKASTGDHTIQVTARPETGDPTKLDVKIKVSERAETAKLALKGPTLTTSIKQGETQTVPLSLKHDGIFTGNVKLKVVSPEKGLTAELTSTSIKGGDSGDVGLKISADKTAALGEHTIQVTGTPDSGTVSPADVRVKVVAR